MERKAERTQGRRKRKEGLTSSDEKGGKQQGHDEKGGKTARPCICVNPADGTLLAIDWLRAADSLCKPKIVTVFDVVLETLR